MGAICCVCVRVDALQEFVDTFAIQPMQNLHDKRSAKNEPHYLGINRTIQVTVQRMLDSCDDPVLKKVTIGLLLS